MLTPIQVEHRGQPPLASSRSSAWDWRLACVFTILLFTARGAPALAEEPLRLWVDASGQFAVEARLQSANDSSVTLLRADGQLVTLLLDQLSENDKTYLLESAESRATANPNRLRQTPPPAPEAKPLPVLDLPPATLQVQDVEALSRDSKTELGIATNPPGPLPADPAPQSVTVSANTFPMFRVDSYDRCSEPIAITMVSEAGSTTNLAMTVSPRVRGFADETVDKLVRFDQASGKAYEAFKYNGTMELLDYHPQSDRLLLLVDFDSSRRGGSLAIGTGWRRRQVQLEYKRSLREESDSRAPELKWAKWVDEEHVVALIDDELGLWNLVSGVQKYHIADVDPRAIPAISGGRHYLAVPVKNGVALYETATGKPLGRIGVERQIPTVAFSPAGNALAVVTSRRLRVWDLPTAAVLSDVPSRRSFGTGTPHWINHDLVLSSTGVLTALSRGLPVWRYDLSSTAATTVGGHLVMFRKHPINRLVIMKLPHDRAQASIDWIDEQTEWIDPDQWRLPGTSKWQIDKWDDQEAFRR